MSSVPLRRQLLVGRDQETAYRLFTDDLGSWWPIKETGRFGDGSQIVVDHDQIVETGSDGDRAVWADIAESHAPQGMSLRWHHNADPATSGTIMVSLTPTGDPAATLITVESPSGTEEKGEPAYADWILALDRLSGLPPVAAEPVEQWYVLQHTAGPATPPGGVFSSPLFARHAEFLRSLAAQQALIAGGPLPDTAGADDRGARS